MPSAGNMHWRPHADHIKMLVAQAPTKRTIRMSETSQVETLNYSGEERHVPAGQKRLGSAAAAPGFHSLLGQCAAGVADKSWRLAARALACREQPRSLLCPAHYTSLLNLAMFHRAAQ